MGRPREPEVLRRRPIVVRSILLVATFVLVASCSSGDQVGGDRSGTGPSVATSDVTTASKPADVLGIDPDDPRPFLTYGYRASTTLFLPSLDLPELSIFPDGRVIGVSTSPNDGEYVAYDLRLDPAEFDRIVELTADLGLTGGGLQPLVPLPPGVGVEDGTTHLFVTRSDGRLTARDVETLDSVPGDDEVPGRTAYLELYRALLPLIVEMQDTERARSQSVQLDRWAIVSAPVEFDDVRDSGAWSGPDLDDVDWQPINGRSLCTIIVDDDWPLESSLIVIDHRVVTRRPLLPYEQTCDDVAELRAVLGLDVVGDASPPADVDVHDTPRWTGGVDGPVVFGRSHSNAEEALASGTVRLTGDDCLVLESPSGPDGVVVRSMIVWRYGTTWHPETSTITVADPPNQDRTIAVGDPIELAGGAHSTADLAPFVTDSAAIAQIDECLTDPTIGDVFVNQS